MSYQSLSNAAQYIRNKCEQCFTVTKPQRPTYELQQQLIEIHAQDEPLKPIHTPIKKQTPPSLPLQHFPQPLSIHRKATGYPGSDPQLHAATLDLQDEFQSIESTYNKERESKASRSFKLFTTASLTKISSISGSAHEPAFKSSDVQTNDWEVTPDNNEPSLLADCTDKVCEWMHREYDQQHSHSNFKISYAIRLRMQGQCMLTKLVHKLEDYRVFYLEEGKSLAHNFQNKAGTFSANFVLSDLGASSFRTAKIMAYYRIRCSTAHVANVLKTFNTREALKIMHNFTLVQLTDRELEWAGQFPIVEAQQVDKKLKRHTTFHVARQLGEVEFQNEEGRQLVEACFSLDEGDSNWQRIIKMLVSKKGCVEIYCESTEEIVSDETSFFASKWAAMLRYLANLKVIAQS